MAVNMERFRTSRNYKKIMGGRGGVGGETDDENRETHKSAFVCIRKTNW